MCFLFLLLFLPFLKESSAQSHPSQLLPNGLNVCHHKFSYNSYYTIQSSYESYENYRTCCKKFIWCTSHCTKYRKRTRYYVKTLLRVKYATSYFCCSGWARVGSSCSQAVCLPPCENGKCVQPNTCECNKGFKGKYCETEINECLAQPPLCQQTCTNLHGGHGYSCSCLRGYRKIENQVTSPKCENVNECKAAASKSIDLCVCAFNITGCKATCLDTLGSYQCHCSSGFRLVANRVCTDQNECTNGVHRCSQICLNKAGGYVCDCYAGYKLSVDERTCSDINECQISNGGCDQRCTNLIGSYKCSCKTGFILLSDRMRCQDIDECVTSRPCDLYHGKCINHVGGYECACKTGYEILYDKKTCKDVNECSRINFCQQSCVNTDGSYVCSCKFGYKLKSDGMTCEDIDECKEKLHGCEHLCENVPGSFKCWCRAGFILHSDGKSCVGLPCKTLYAPHHGTVNCTGFYVGDICQFGCSTGFELHGVGVKICLQKSRWSNGEPKCAAMECPAAKPPVNGMLILPCIEEYRSQCIIKCKKGYNLRGENTIDCNMNGSITKWKSNSTCDEIRLCAPNPCQHGGICQVISNLKYRCDCSNTGYIGDHCQVGELKVPEYPQMKVGEESEELVIKANPDNQLLITLETEIPNSAVFTPSNSFELVAPQDQVTFKISPKRKGLIIIKYVLSGADSFNFVQPKDGILYSSDRASSNRLSSIPDTNFMKSNCHILNIDRCPMAHNLQLSSSCRWEVLGTTGYVSISSGALSLPLSLTGVSLLANEGIKRFHRSGILTVARGTQEMLSNGRTTCAAGKTCTNAIQGDFEHEFLLKRNHFLRFFYKSVKPLNPWWIVYDLPADHNGFHVNDIQTLLIKQKRMKDLHVCKNLPSTFTGTSSVLVTHAPITIVIMSQRYTIDSIYPTCIAVDLCSKVSFVSLPEDKMLFPSHAISSVSIKIKGMGFSEANVVGDDCIEFWNDIERKNVQHCIQTKIWLKGSILFNTENANLSFNGELSSAPANMKNLATERFNMEQNVIFRGVLSGKISITVHSKKLNLIYAAEKVAAFARLGGTSYSPCMACSTKGIHLSMLTAKLLIDYETSALRMYPSSNIGKLQARLYYDITQGHVILIENLPRIKLMLRFLGNSISAQTRGLQFSVRPMAAKYLLELGQILKISSVILSQLHKDTVIVSSGDPKYGDVFIALSNTKKLVAPFIDVLVAFKDAVYNTEVNPLVIKRVGSQVLNLRRTLNTLTTLEAIPKVSYFREFFDGVSISYFGKVCVHSLCFENSHIFVYDLKRDESQCNSCWNMGHTKLSVNTYISIITMTARKLGDYVHVKSGAVVKVELSKKTDDFTIKIPATVSMFGQVFEVVVHVDKELISYTVKNVSFATGVTFDIQAKGHVRASTTWRDISFSYQGKTSVFSTLVAKMEALADTMIKNIAKRTMRRINETRLKLMESNALIIKYKAEAGKLKADMIAKNIQRRIVTAQYRGHQLNYSSMLKTFQQYFVGDFIRKLDGKLNKTCQYDTCKEVCFTMPLYDMCQDKQFLVANELRCDQVQRKTRTTTLEPFKTECEMIKHNFIPIYTGTCRKGGQSKLKNSLMATGAGVGGLVGSVIPGVGTAIGSLVGTAVGYFASLFSSCDESYEVFKQVINYQQPCVHKRYNTRTKVFTITNCFPVQRLVLSDYGVPYSCPVSNSTCIPIIDPVCTQKNNECRMKRDIVRTGELQRAGVYNKTWFQLNYFQIKVQQYLILTEKANSDAAEARREYERKEALLKEAVLEEQFARISIQNIDLTLRLEKCILALYKTASSGDNFVKFSDLAFKTSTPVPDNLLLEFYVRGGKAGTIAGEFLFAFQDQDISILHGVRKIIQQYLCSGEIRRRRRSIVENISFSPLGQHNDYIFQSNDMLGGGTDADAVCLSSRTIFAHFAYLSNKLKKLVDLSMERKNELKNSLASLQKTINILQSRQGDPVIKVQLIWLRETHANGINELEEYSGRNVLTKWRQDMELYTQNSNFSACLDFSDCLETALGNLRELPSMITVTRSEYVKKIDHIESMFLKLYKSSMTFSTLKMLHTELENALKTFRESSLFCVGVPLVRLTSPSRIVSFEGDVIELECKATSPLPVSYSWKLDNRTLLFETQSKVKVYMQATSFGSYVCEVWSLAGKNRSAETYVILQKKPVITTQPNDFTFLTTVTTKVEPSFECNVTADPPAKISWYYQSYNSQSQSLKLHSTKSVLKIKSPTLTASGFYYCVAINQHGSTRSRKARLDVLKGDVPHQQVSVEFDLSLGGIDMVNRTEYKEKIVKDSKLSQQQRIEVDVQAAGSVDVKFEVKLEDNSNDPMYGFKDANLIRTVSKKRQSLSEGVQRLVSGFVDAKGKTTAAEMEKTMIIGFDGDKCPTGNILHENGFTCVPCRAGSYGYYGACLLCPIGSYQPLAGQSKCLDCSATEVTTAIGAINKWHCQAPTLGRMDVILLVDTSNNQSSTQFNTIRLFLVKFYKDYLHRNTDLKLGLITFNNDAVHRIQLKRLGDDPSVMLRIFEKLTIAPSYSRKTDVAINFVSKTFHDHSSTSRRKLLISIITGPTYSTSTIDGFSALRHESLNLHREGIQSAVVAVDNSDETELLALASTKKEDHIFRLNNNLDTIGQTLAAAALKGICALPGKDIGIAIQSSSNINDNLWSNILNFIKSFVNRLRNVPSTRFGIVSFSSEIIASKFQKLESEMKVNDGIKSLVRANGVNISNALEFLFNTYLTEKFGSLSEMKILIVITEKRIENDVFAKLKKMYSNDDVRFYNIIMALQKQDAGLAEFGVEESEKVVYSLGELFDLVKRVKSIVPILKKECVHSDQSVKY